ncbi:MAG: hypothetical protein H0T79_24255 [Deltaproteobacteria bacterium]|nr:hypothetical protein [Deltaproteobacteria bacterium]
MGIAVAFGLSCANNVAQNKHSGEDASFKKPKEIRFENDQAVAKGIVTYPGGDRADWKLVELPEKKFGTLEIKLTWTPPRPGLQLAFDVYDEYFHEAVKSKASARKKRGQGRIKNETVENAKGKYYIRVFAVNRGDAGKYTLTLDFKEQSVGPIFNPHDLVIPDPPRLADIPAIIIPCDDTNFDAKKDECKNYCPKAGAPAGWGPCKGACTEPVDPQNLACWRDPGTRPPCPKPWDPKFQQWCPAPACPNPPDPINPNCAAKPIVARVLSTNISGGDTLITVAAGSAQGITKGWRANVLRGGTEQPFPGGDGTIIRVDKTNTAIKVKLTPDQLKANDTVKLSPP